LSENFHFDPPQADNSGYLAVAYIEKDGIHAV
jgi:hypothetical protein